MIWMRIGFILLILCLLALDLFILNRKAHVIRVKEALLWSALWISLGLSFSIFVYFGYQHHWLGLGKDPDTGKVAIDPIGKVPLEGHVAAVKYLTGYLIEESLSVDNLFVIALIFSYFGVAPMYQHRVLFWGILGALIMRGAMIWIGAELISRYHWIIWIFGAFLIFTGIRMLFIDAENADPSANPILKLARKILPFTEHYHGQHFIVRAGSDASREPVTPDGEVVNDSAVAAARAGKLLLTPLALTLIMVETTDLIFAVDSIPAIFAITGDPFIVYNSNVFAILGLRSLFFALAGMMDKFRYLKFSLAIILTVVGIKMLGADWFKDRLGPHFDFYLLGFIGAVLAGGVIASLIANRRDANNGRMPPSNPAAKIGSS